MGIESCPRFRRDIAKMLAFRQYRVMPRSPRFKDQRKAAWIFGSIAFAALLCFVFLGPKELPTDRRQALGILFSLLCGLFGFFFTGNIKLVTEGKFPKWGKVSIQASGGIALFVFVMLWWNSGAGPVREMKQDVQEIKQTTAETKALVENLMSIQKRDTSGSELLAEFRQRLEAMNFSTLRDQTGGTRFNRSWRACESAWDESR